MKERLGAIREQVQQELWRSVDFWLEHGMDAENGGIYTCLDREGAVYSTDKSVWMQARAAWLFSHLCAVYGARPEWMAAAKSCLDFMHAHCFNPATGGKRMYFTVTADGKPLRQRRYCFSEAFYTIACAEHAALTGDDALMQKARDTYELLWKLNRGLMEDPAGLGPKTDPATRSGRALADPMIYLNTSSVLRRCDPGNAGFYALRAGQSAQDIFNHHHKPELSVTLETVGRDGEFWRDVSAGRVVNPGHSIECAWFLLEHAAHTGGAALRDKAVEMFDFAYAIGHDTEYGGLLYLVDALGRPPEAYEHDMKLWWPHNELAIASLMIYRDTGREEYLAIFLENWDYMLRVFRDEEHGEWYGYLRRDGAPTQPAAKGSTFKGPFHLPRMLVMLDGMLGQLAEAEA